MQDSFHKSDIYQDSIQDPTDPDSFRFCIPADIIEKADGRRMIQGFVSTEHEDREGETILQDGLDFSEFLEYGWFNDNHQKTTKSGLGWPLAIEKKTTDDGKKGHWVEGELLRGYGPSDEIWELSQALKKSGGKRKLAFSVEGKIKSRASHNKKIITKGVVRDVAITRSPVNPYAGMNAFQKSFRDHVSKAMMAGSDIVAPPATPGNAFALRTEQGSGTGKNKKKRKRKRLGRKEGILHIMQCGYSKSMASRIYDLAVQGVI